MAHEADHGPALPVSVISPADVNRLLAELETISGTMLDHTLRKDGGEGRMLRTSQMMEQTTRLNKLNLLHETDRQQLEEFLRTIKEHAPVLHFSFSADPSATFLEKLMTWLRKEISPQVLLTVGLQPSIGAGCIMRSTNQYFDFSLRQDFAKKRELLIDELASKEKKVAEAARS